MWGFPGGSDSKESSCNAGDLGLIPGLGRSPGGGHGNPLQYSWLENPLGQRSMAGYSPWGQKELDMTEQLSTYSWQNVGYTFLSCVFNRISYLSWWLKPPWKVTHFPLVSPVFMWGIHVDKLLHCFSVVSLSFIREDLGQEPTHSSVIARRIPRDGRAWWAAVYGVAQSQTRLKWLSSNNSHLLHSLPPGCLSTTVLGAMDTKGVEMWSCP